MKSRYLNQRQLRTLERLGDCLLPGAAGLPRFSHTGAIEHIDAVLEPVDTGDRRDLRLLLSLLALFPNRLLIGLMRLLAARHRLPALVSPLIGALRLLDVSLRGLVFTLYYSNRRGLNAQGPAVHDAMDFQLHCEPTEPHRGAPS